MGAKEVVSKGVVYGEIGEDGGSWRKLSKGGEREDGKREEV